MQAEKTEHILQLMRCHGIQQFHYSDSEEAISLSLSPESQKTIRAPFAGHFLPKHPMADKRIIWSTRGRKGEVIGYIKNGPLLRPVIAPEDCHTSVAKVVDGTFVGYDDALFEYTSIAPDHL